MAATTAATSAQVEKVKGELTKFAQEAQELRNSVAQYEAQEREHKVAVEVLQGLDKSRKCYRLVGDVLVENSVDEALASVQGNMENLQAVIKKCTERSLEIEKEVKVLTAPLK